MNTNQLLTALLFALVSVYTAAATDIAAQEAPDVEHGVTFVDENGDGYNDNAPDADNDGIPNGQDADYERNAGNAANARNGRNQGGQGNATADGHGNRFVDEDGDGFNDNAPDADNDGIPNGQDDDYAPQGQAIRRNEGAGNGSGNTWSESRREQTGSQHQAGIMQQQRLHDGNGTGSGPHGAGNGSGTGNQTRGMQNSGTGAHGMHGGK